MLSSVHNNPLIAKKLILAGCHYHDIICIHSKVWPGPRRVIQPKETLTDASVTSSASLDLHHARVTHALRLASSGICGGGRTRSGTACPLFNLSHKTLVVGDVPPGFLPVRYHLRVHTEQNALREMPGACGDFAKHQIQPIASIQPITIRQREAEYCGILRGA